MAGELMSVADGGQPPPNRGYLRAAVSLGRQKGGNGLRSRGEGRDTFRLAPGAE